MPKDFDIKNKFDTYIHFVLKQVHPDIGITEASTRSLNLMLHNLAERMCNTMSTLTLKSDKKTITSREVQTAVRLLFPGELGKHAVDMGVKAVTKYTSSSGGSKSNPSTKAKRSGLVVAPGLAERILRAKTTKSRIGQGAPVYFAAVLEYFSAEILELSGTAARDNKVARITPRHLTLAVQNDEELRLMFKDASLAAGVLPNIHAVLLPKRKYK